MRQLHALLGLTEPRAFTRAPPPVLIVILACVLTCCSGCMLWCCCCGRPTEPRKGRSAARGTVGKSLATDSLTTPAAAPGAPKCSVMWDRPALDPAQVPPPRVLSQMPLPVTSGLPHLSKPHERAKLRGILSVRSDDLPSETGDFEVLRVSDEGEEEVALHGRVQKHRGIRELLLAASSFDQAAVRCVPTRHPNVQAGEQQTEPCSAVELYNWDGNSWGTIMPRGSDSYAVVRVKDQVLAIEGIEEQGRLVVVSCGHTGAEPAAHAERVRPADGGPKRVELGVRPQLDPLLALACVLGVLVFNPQEHLPTPSVGKYPWR